MTLTSRISVADLMGLDEISCDVNARVSDTQFVATCVGTSDDLRRLALELESAVGRQFLFNAALDMNEMGEDCDFMFVGCFTKQRDGNIVIEMDDRGFFWRSHKDGSVASD